MKVIERASEGWDKVVRCPECRSTLEVELADLMVHDLLCRLAGLDA